MQVREKDSLQPDIGHAILFCTLACWHIAYNDMHFDFKGQVSCGAN